MIMHGRNYYLAEKACKVLVKIRIIPGKTTTAVKNACFKWKRVCNISKLLGLSNLQCSMLSNFHTSTPKSIQTNLLVLGGKKVRSCLNNAQLYENKKQESGKHIDG